MTARHTPRRGAADEPDRQFVTALARGLDILGCFSASRPEIGGTQLAAMTGLPQPTVWRLCYTMVRLGYLVPVSGDKLRPGIPVLKLGRAALASIPLAEAARAPMQAIANRFGSASGMGARDGGRMVFVQRCLSEAQLVMNLRVGARLPLLTSAVGWGLLAGFDQGARDALIAEYAPADPRWPEVRTAFHKAMASYAKDGFILNLGVFHSGYNTVAVPVRGLDRRPLFGLSCAGSASTHSAAFLRGEVAPVLLATARTLEQSPEAQRGHTS
ncbi:IclR family transcriptional regulator [Acidisphaera sp. L21]|uniref:IclR family transcriptional regulator n=1 Tax=Acidisphaera sp. L21 TaxID=1641851 RepID=UPI00131D2AAE|nr:IclR family transcriptional regulator [Acidisphaera sp. L21]